MYCIKCGKELQEGMQFCDFCGIKISDMDIENKQSGKGLNLMSKDETVNQKVQIKSRKKGKIIVPVAFGVLFLGVIVFFILLNTNMIFCCMVLGHRWQEATCETPKNCVVCKEMEGEVLMHQWQKATCETPQNCMLCRKIEGKVLGHQWQEATTDTPRTCIECGITEGEPLRGVLITEITEYGRTVREYDYRGFLTKTSYYGLDGSLRSSNSYCRLVEGTDIKEEICVMHGSGGSIEGFNAAIYDEQGNVTCVKTWYEGDGSSSVVKYEYDFGGNSRKYIIYNEQGNLLLEE